MYNPLTLSRNRYLTLSCTSYLEGVLFNKNQTPFNKEKLQQNRRILSFPFVLLQPLINYFIVNFVFVILVLPLYKVMVVVIVTVPAFFAVIFPFESIVAILELLEPNFTVTAPFIL